ncbi:hypothetical protein ACFL0J_01655 [Candidatus Neomarinimicrobiota bacterium]
MRIKLLFTTIIILLFCCSTPYQPYGALGGYKSSQIGDNSYRVLFKGNQHTHGETVYNNLDRRCAEITIENGYSHFIIYEDSSYIDKTVFDNEPELDDRIAAQRKDNYLLDRQPEIDTNPIQTLSDQKSKIGRTYWKGTISAESKDVVGILKIQLFNEIRKGFENQYISAEQILEKYKED